MIWSKCGPSILSCLFLYGTQAEGNFYIFKWFEKVKNSDIGKAYENQISMSVSKVSLKQPG
jgi:hypothetical protein